MAAKSVGAWNLHECTQGCDLDFFVMFSSVASVWPQPGHGSYAAANAFLDALAHYRLAMGKAGLSVNWGVWDSLGLAKNAGTRRTIEGYRMQGIENLSKDQALAGLGCVLQQRVPQILALPVDWKKFSAFHAGSNVLALFSELATTAQVPVEEAAAGGIRQELEKATTVKERRETVENYLKSELSRVLKMPLAKISTEKPMGTMGLDSLMALEFVRRLARGTGLVFPATTVFNYPTIAAMTDHVASRLDGSEPRAGEMERHVKATAAMAGVAAISDEEALQALMGRGKA
jgi:acyl carrier protein